MPKSYQIGDRVEVRVTFRDSAGDLADPTLVVIKTRSGSGAEASHAAVNESTGVYTAAVDIDTPGRWFYRGIGTGAVVAADEGSFMVEKSAFENP